MSVIVRQIFSEEVTLLQDLLTAFGKAFEDLDTYTESVLDRTTCGDCWQAIPLSRW
jgi:hypothetical protein